MRSWITSVVNRRQYCACLRRQ